jgi:regulator of replication initiation timing
LRRENDDLKRRLGDITNLEQQINTLRRENDDLKRRLGDITNLEQ